MFEQSIESVKGFGTTIVGQTFQIARIFFHKMNYLKMLQSFSESIEHFITNKTFEIHF